MNIILIVDQYFTERDEYRYGIDVFNKYEYNIKVWDLSKILQPGSIDIIKNNIGEFNPKYIKRYDSNDHVLKDIYRIKTETFFITTIIYLYQTLPIFKAISKKGFQYGSTGPYSINIFPKFQYSLAVNNPSKKKLVKIFFSKLYRIGLKIPLPLFGINHSAFFALAGGASSKAVGPLIGAKTEIKHIHAADYDYCLCQDNNKKKNQKRDYIVYIDQAIYNAPDMIARNEQFDIDIEKYFKDLRRFFDRIETELDMKVIIAAAPKINYSGNEHYFGNRKIMHGFNSAEIISNSFLVLLHYSLAINFAVIYKKPIMFITSDIINLYKKPFIDGISNHFSCKPINITHDTSKLIIPDVDHELYERYFIDYIKKPGTDNKPFWEQVISLINQ